MSGRKVKEPKLKHSNAEMASSTAVTSFDSLPDELALKIVTMAAWATDREVTTAEGETYIDERQVTSSLFGNEITSASISFI